MTQRLDTETDAEDGLTRRTLVKGMAASSVSVVLAGCSLAPGADSLDTTDTPSGDDDGQGRVPLRIEEYPKAKVASLSEIGREPIGFDYPLDGQSNFAVKLGGEARGGIGPDGDIVAFTYTCSHMGCSLEGTYKDDHSMLGACPCHLSRFDLTNHGMVITGHATQSLPQVALEIEDGDVYATGVMGLLYGYRDNLKDGQPSEIAQAALGGGATEQPKPTPTPSSGDGSGSGSDSGSGTEPDFDGWFENVGNFDGVVDRTGQDTVEVAVGTEANNGNFGYAPPAVAVSTGTTVVWRWNGKGGGHNVVAEDGSFESELTSEEGHTFEQTFDSPGTVKYYCQPHRAMGMKGAVVVEQG